MLSQLRGEGLRLESLATLWYSCLRAKRPGDHPGLERGHGHLEGACEVRRWVIPVEEMANHLATALVVTLAGQGGSEKSNTASLSTDQSQRAQSGVGGGTMMAAGCRVKRL